MLTSLAVAGYRSLRDLVLPLESLNLITGPNGSGKSNLYRGLRLLSQTAFGTATASLASEGGIDSVLWAGPEKFTKAAKRGDASVQGGPRSDTVSLRFGFASDEWSYAIDFGLPQPVPRTMFSKDPEVKREAIWLGDVWHARRAMVDRRGSVVRARDDSGRWEVIERHLPAFESMLSRLADPGRAPEALLLREEIRSWRFYDHFRTDADSPARRPQIGTRTLVLANDGHDLAAAWRTIEEIGDAGALEVAVCDAFPGASVSVIETSGRFELEFAQRGLLRPLRQAELSDGTLRYLLWIAALLTPRPPTLMVLNEPETSLHPELLPALGRLMLVCAEETQLWVISHSSVLVEALTSVSGCNHLELDKQLSATYVQGQHMLEAPPWKWPSR
ncbi:MAG: ATP-binding protein [Gammaproteobacteria bacterium]|nr:ATP-binding protein [Gammaproteobacteria bacterium]